MTTILLYCLYFCIYPFQLGLLLLEFYVLVIIDITFTKNINLSDCLLQNYSAVTAGPSMS